MQKCRQYGFLYMPCLMNIPTTALTTLIDKENAPCHTRKPSSHWQLRAMSRCFCSVV